MLYDRPFVGMATAIAARPETGDAPPGRATRRDLLTPVALGITLVPLAVVFVHMLRRDFVLTGDLATTEMLTRDVGSRSPSVGPFSRDGWYHPGPALFYALALPYRLLGRDGPALTAGAVIVNAASVTTMALLARRRGGTGLMLATLLGCGVLMHALGATFLATPWNVYVTVLPYGALLFLVWAMLGGERWALPGATLVTTFLMQTHIGYVALALPLLVGATGWVVGAAVVDRRRRRRPVGGATEAAASTAPETSADGADGGTASDGGDTAATTPGPAPGADAAPPRGGLLVPAVVALLVAVVAWMPPLVQQVTHVRGNVDRIVEWFRDGGEEARTLLEGWRVVADQYTWPPEWVDGQAPLFINNEPAAVYQRVVPLLLLPVLAAAALVWRRRGGPARALAVTWFAASAVAVVATARTVGPLYAYRLHWAWVLGMLGGVFVAWAAWTLAAGRTGDRACRATTAVGLAALVAIAGATTVEAVRADPPAPEAGELAAGLVGDTTAALADVPGNGPVVVEMGSFGAIGPGLGLVDELERAGVDVLLDSVGVGSHRRYEDGDAVRARLLVGLDTDIVPATRRPDVEMVAFAGRVDMAQLMEDAARQDELARKAEAGTLTGDELRRAAARALPPYSAAAVFLVTSAPAG